MLTAAVALAAIAAPKALSFTRPTTPLPSNIQFYEIFMNPPGGGDDNSGLEYIVVRGPANTSLNTYAIAAVENEHSSSGANDIGTLDMLIPLDGYSTDANGICVIRDLNGSGNLGTFSPADTTSGTHEFAFQWQDDSNIANFGYTYTGATRSGSAVSTYFGGNTLENEGTNLFIVQYVNKDLVQELDGVSKGTALDVDHDGQLDYTESTKPTGWIQPWDNAVSDAVFIPLKNKALGTNASTQQVDYTGSVAATTRISVERHSGSTPDVFFRLNDTLALVSDMLNAGSNVYNVDSSEVYFSNDTITTSLVGAVSPASLSSIQIEIGTMGYFTVKNTSTNVQYTH